MPSSKDIVAAQRYNRRRLVAAFSSGTPDGREVVAASPSRPLIAGGVLALVLVLVAVIAGRFAPALPSGWQDNTLLVVNDTGARYFSISGVLRPVTNVTSARLLAEPSSFKTGKVDAATLAGIPRGSAVGIPEAPDMLPPTDLLRSALWTACSTTSGGTRTWVARTPARLADAASALVSSGDRLYLIAEGRRHLVANDDVRFALGLESAAVHPVDAAWLALFDAGSELKPLEIPGYGAPANGEDVPARLGTAVVGSVVRVEEGASQRTYVFTGPNEITPLTAVAYALYRIGSGAELGNNPLTATLAEIAGLPVRAQGLVPADWPGAVGEAVPTRRQVCARLVEVDKTASTSLAQAPVQNPDEVAADTPGTEVAGGSGALVRATSGGTLGAISLVTDLGLAYGVAGTASETLTRLGYAEQAVHPLPSGWLALVPQGVALSREAAWATVKAQ